MKTLYSIIALVIITIVASTIVLLVSPNTRERVLQEITGKTTSSNEYNNTTGILKKPSEHTSKVLNLSQNINTQTLTFGQNYKMKLPTNWTHAPAPIKTEKVINVFDNNGKLAMQVIGMNSPRGFEMPYLSMKKSSILANIGKVHKYTITNSLNGGIEIIYNYGFWKKGFEIDIGIDKNPFGKGINEYNKGAGFQNRNTNLAEFEKDTTLKSIIQSISLDTGSTKNNQI